MKTGIQSRAMIPFYVCRSKTPEEQLASMPCEQAIFDWLQTVPSSQHTLHAVMWLVNAGNKVLQEIERDVAQCEAGRVRQGATPDEQRLRITLATRGPSAAPSPVRSDMRRTQVSVGFAPVQAPAQCPSVSWRMHCDVVPEITTFAPDVRIDGRVNYRFENSQNAQVLYGNSPSTGAVIVADAGGNAWLTSFLYAMGVLQQSKRPVIEALVEGTLRAVERYPRPPSIPGEPVPVMVDSQWYLWPAVSWGQNEADVSLPIGVDYTFPGGVLHPQGPQNMYATMRPHGPRLSADNVYAGWWNPYPQDPFDAVTVEQAAAMAQMSGRHQLWIQMVGRPSFTQYLQDTESHHLYSVAISDMVAWTPGVQGVSAFPVLNWEWDVVNVSVRGGTPLLTLTGLEYCPAIQCVYFHVLVGGELAADLAFKGVFDHANKFAVMASGSGMITLVGRLSYNTAGTYGIVWQPGQSVARAHTTASAVLLRPGSTTPDADSFQTFTSGGFYIPSDIWLPWAGEYDANGTLRREVTDFLSVTAQAPGYDQNGNVDFEITAYGGTCPGIGFDIGGGIVAHRYSVTVIDTADPRYGSTFEVDAGFSGGSTFVSLYGSIHVIQASYLRRRDHGAWTEFFLTETNAMSAAALAAETERYMKDNYPAPTYTFASISEALIRAAYFAPKDRVVSGDLEMTNGILCEVFA